MGAEGLDVACEGAVEKAWLHLVKLVERAIAGRCVLWRVIREVDWSSPYLPKVTFGVN